tara:strand:- start:145 stop:558 length:414 start_codon:yes stop_codon:yes gene_type:complete
MNNNKRLTRGDFETLMGLFGEIIKSCDRPTGKKILDVLMDIEHTIFDYNEEHEIDQCDCSECKSDRKKDRKINKLITSAETLEDIEELKKDLSKDLEKIRTLVTKEKKSSRDEAYKEWKNDFLKKKQKKDSAKEGEK